MKEIFQKLFDVFGKKLIVIIVGLALGALKAKFPNAPLPNQDLLVQLIMAFLACHTLTDVIAVLKSGAASGIAADELTKALDKFKANDSTGALAMLEDMVKSAK
jgi:hypothetical protein